MKVKDALVAWTRGVQKSWVSGVWKMILIAIWWTTWKERNQPIFDGKEMFFQDFKVYFLKTLYSWSHVLNDGTNLPFLDFVDNNIMHGA